MKATQATKTCIACQCIRSKCDHQLPCSKCQSAGIQCEYGEAKTGPQTREKLRERVAKLEGLLKVIVDKMGEADNGTAILKQAKTECGTPLTQDGKTIYIANSVWSTICDEIDILEENPSPTSDLVFGFASYTPIPYGREASILWRIYLQNIDPLTKVVDQNLIEALLVKETLSEQEDALLSSCWYSAVNSLNEKSCATLLGYSRQHALLIHRRKAEQALLNANYLQSLSLNCLTAFVVYLLVDPTSSLLSIAVQISQKIGLDKDGSLFNLTTREVELRQRLWYQIVHMDARACELSGTLSRIMPLRDSHSDTMFPSNNLLGGETASETCFIRFRACIGTYYRHLYQDNIKADKMLRDLETYLEQTFIASADPLDNLQFFTSLTARHVLSSLKISNILKSLDKDLVLAESVKCMEYDNLAISMPNLECFRWHVKSYFQYHIFINILKDLRTRKTGPLAENAWTQIEEVYKNRSEMLKPDALHSAIRRLTIEAWDGRSRPQPVLIINLLLLSGGSNNNFENALWSSHLDSQTDLNLLQWDPADYDSLYS